MAFFEGSASVLPRFLVLFLPYDRVFSASESSVGAPGKSAWKAPPLWTRPPGRSSSLSRYLLATLRYSWGFCSVESFASSRSLSEKDSATRRIWKAKSLSYRPFFSLAILWWIALAIIASHSLSHFSPYCPFFPIRAALYSFTTLLSMYPSEGFESSFKALVYSRSDLSSLSSSCLVSDTVAMT